jgi:3-methyladenine DNA glycosylase AlkD
MTETEVMQQLRSLGKEQTAKTYRRHGVRGDVFGVSYGDLGKLKKRIKVDHALAVALWRTGNHDARILATMVADPAALDERTLDAWARDLDSYPIADAFAGLAAQSPAARRCMERWTTDDGEWVGRAGWLVLARLAGDGGALSDAELAGYLPTIEREIHTRKNRVRDAMNSALIAVGIRNAPLREQALAAAARIGTVDVDHGETNCKTPDAAEYIRKTVAYREGKRRVGP